jgi:hypothetical protein
MPALIRKCNIDVSVRDKLKAGDAATCWSGAEASSGVFRAVLL